MAINFPNSPSNGDVFGNFTYDTSIPGWRKTPENSASLPAGTIVQWPGATAPANWLLADGAAVSRTTYASLFSAIGVQYGSGDGTTTFNLPNLKGKVAVGLDSSQTEFDTLGETGGAKTHTLTTSELPSHTHANTLSSNVVASSTHAHGASSLIAGLNIFRVGGETYFDYFERGGGFTENARAYLTAGGTVIGGRSEGAGSGMGIFGDTDAANATTTVGITNASAGSGTAHNNLQPYIVLNYIIKTSAGITSADSELATRLASVENKFNTGQNDAPAGSITQFAGATIPANWLLCDGAAVSRSTWPSLFSAIGTTYGVGDGTTTFNLPDIPNGTGTGVVGQAVSTSVISVSSSTPSDMAGMTTTVALKAGRTYKITFSSSQLGGSTTSARARVDFYVGATFWERQYYGTGNVSYGAPFVAESYYTSPSDQTVVVKLQGSIDVGSGTFTWYADASYSKNVFTVEDMGESVSTASLRQKHIIKATAGVATNDGTFVTRVGAVETSVNALQVADSTTNKSGLVPIVPASLTLNSGSGTIDADGVITITSGASNIGINLCFSSLYQSYKILYNLSLASDASVSYRLRSGTTTETSAYYDRSMAYMGGNTVGAQTVNAQDGWNIGVTGEALQWGSIELTNPFAATATTGFSNMGQGDSSSIYAFSMGSLKHRLSNSYDGLTILSVANLTGTIQILGYR